MFRSIRIRLTFWYLGVLGLMMVAFALTVYFLVASNLDVNDKSDADRMSGNVEAELRQEYADIKEEIEAGEVEGDLRDALDSAIEEEIRDLSFEGYYFRVLGPDGKAVVSTFPDPGVGTSVESPAAERYSEFAINDEAYLIRTQKVALGDSEYTLQVGRPLQRSRDFLAGLRRILYVTLPIVLVLAGLGGYLLARQSLAPVVAMSRQAERISHTNLSSRLAVSGSDDELSSLAAVFNSLLERLERAFQRQRRFMADASHELRTPLTVIRTESEVSLSNPERTPEEYRGSLEVVQSESKRLSAIVDDLFLLSRKDSGALKPEFSELDLMTLLRESADSMRSMAEAERVTIDCEEGEPIALTGDKELLGRMIRNLIDNGIKYNNPGGGLRIAAASDGNTARITFTDTGSGIDPEDASRIFDRFYRADKARTAKEGGANGGTGLGLSIAGSIAELHGGTIRLLRSDSKGSVFEIDIPLLPSTAGE